MRLGEEKMEMVNRVRLIELGKLIGHAGNANVMSSAAFGKLVRNEKIRFVVGESACVGSIFYV